MRYQTQDPKYDIEVTEDGARIVVAASGKPIPEDEPIMIFRAQDRKAATHIWNYSDGCANSEHRRIVEGRAADFEQFASEHPERMKEPDTTPNAELNGAERAANANVAERKPNSQVENYLAKLEEGLGEVEESMYELRRRLSPFLMPEPEQEAVNQLDPPSPVMPETAWHIHRMNERVRVLYDSIGDILSRL